MRKLYLLLLLLPLATMMSSGRAHAADPDKALYDAAIAAFPSGGYYITTVIDGVKYYVTASGSLEERTDDVATEDGLFTINQVSGGALYDIGWHIEGANGHFSNTTLTIGISPSGVATAFASGATRRFSIHTRWLGARTTTRLNSPPLASLAARHAIFPEYAQPA